MADELAGISMSLGAFLAGVLLADSEYRHEIEAQIEPFRGLLLGFSSSRRHVAGPEVAMHNRNWSAALLVG